ncbi:MAG: flagellar M-ring protein FliF C-terminal domain-containing protein [Candidatus Marinamargulisbacteria bacterium]
MAEDNPLENDFDDSLETLDGLGLDDDALESNDTNQSSAPSRRIDVIRDRLLAILSAIKTNRRYQVITGVVVGAVLVLSVVWQFRGASETKNPVAVMTQQEAPTFDSSVISKKKTSKKKKKKIKYVDLYKQLESKQMGAILRELSYNNIAYNILQNGKQFDLQVDQTQLTDAKHLLAIKGLPTSTAKGYEIFDEASNLGVTEFDKRIRLVRALSGEMERSIMQFDVVDYAYVEIVIPETRLFAVTQPPVTSSILIKRKNGANVNDETVYAIIQLVANSVENLLPENISVVDTEGRVLSTGVMDRMTQKINADKKQSRPVTTSMGNGKVIIPVIEDVVDWFQLKFNYETVLEKKSVNQLVGVLPSGSYKTAVTIDLNSVSQTGAPDIKQIVTSVVVDDQYDEVTLNEATMAQIRQAVAGAVGYVEGRDQIHISNARFLPKRASVVPNDEATIVQKDILPRDTAWDKIKRLMRFWPILAIGCVLTSGVLIIAGLLRSLVHQVGRWVTWGIHRVRPPQPVVDTPDVADIEPVVPDITEDMVTQHLKSVSNFSKIIQLKAASTQDLTSVVDQLRDMVGEDNE